MASWGRAVAACAVAAACENFMASILVLMGPQGAGKGTQAQLLAERFNLPIVATGEMLRDIAITDTPLGHQVREVQAAGQLVSDDILAEVVKTRLGQGDCKDGCILDGFPRTLPQARLLERISHAQGHQIFVVKIDVPREFLFKRLAGRRTCTACGAIYHVEFNPPAQDGICDLDGQPLFARSDDYPEAIENRLALYDEKTRPLVDYYAESNRLHKVDGTGPREEVFKRIADIFKSESTPKGERKMTNDD
jgi:adenylate kinase